VRVYFIITNETGICKFGNGRGKIFKVPSSKMRRELHETLTVTHFSSTRAAFSFSLLYSRLSSPLGFH